MCKICKSNNQFKSGICKNCFDKYPATFDKNEYQGIVYTKNCEKHGIYLTSNSRRKCQQCIDEEIYKRKHTCNICQKFVENRDQNGRGYECGCHEKWMKQHMEKIHIKNSSSGNCKICGKWNENRLTSGIGIDCGCNINISIKAGNKSKELNTEPGYCTVCGNFSYKRNIAGMCQECLNKHNRNNANLNKAPGKCVVCGTFNSKRNINGMGFECGCAIKQIQETGYECSKSNFELRNGTLYYFDLNSNDYILWDSYKLKFNKLNNINFLNEIKTLYPNSFMQSTFRTQDSGSWNGSRQAFERNLMENNIYWFTYIKFYIDENGSIKPLVVGKSGSLNVNINGSDVSFSTNVNDGPARRFLFENQYRWCKTQILIIPCSNELEALEIEKHLQYKYSLFGS